MVVVEFVCACSVVPCWRCERRERCVIYLFLESCFGK